MNNDTPASADTPLALKSNEGLGPDEDLMSTICKMLAERGWFIRVEASRIGEHFTISEVPKAGWALRYSNAWNGQIADPAGTAGLGA